MKKTNRETVVVDGKKQWKENYFLSCGVVYLFQCSQTGVCKFGGTVDPIVRFNQLMVTGAKKGYDLVYRWSVITNSVAELESQWDYRWTQYKPPRHPSKRGRSSEWVKLPESEIALFMANPVVTLKNHPPIPDSVLESLAPLADTHPYRRPRAER